MLLADAFFVILALMSGYACVHVGRGLLSLKLVQHEHGHINYCQRFYAQPKQLPWYYYCILYSTISHTCEVPYVFEILTFPLTSESTCHNGKHYVL